MQKRKVRQIPIPEKPENGCTVLHGKVINHERHTILDVYTDKRWSARYVMTKDSFGSYSEFCDWSVKEIDWWPYGRTEWKIFVGGETVQTELSKKDKENIEKALKKTQKIRAKKQQKKADDERRKMKEDFRTLPDLPKDFEAYCRKATGAPPIWYTKKGKKAVCLCGKCNHEFSYRWDYQTEPIRERMTECPKCKSQGYFEWRGRVKEWHRWQNVLLMQKTKKDELVLRIFYADKWCDQNHPEAFDLREEQRIFLSPGKCRRYSDWWLWNADAYAWGKGGKDIPGMVIYQTMPEGTTMKHFDALAWLRAFEDRGYIVNDANKAYVLTKLLICQARHPETEMYLKTGLPKLAVSVFDGWTVKKKKSGSMAERLRITPEGLKQLKQLKGNFYELIWQQAVKASGIQLHHEEWEKLRSILPGYQPEDKITALKDMMEFVTPLQIIHRAEEYAHEYGEGQESYAWEQKRACEHYRDYLTMKAALGYDMQNSVFLHPHSLREAHDTAVDEKRKRESENYIKAKRQQYKRIEERFEGLTERYAWKHEGLQIRPAKDAGEIILEGRTLHHCVGTDTYLKKHDKGASTILFLRKEESLNESYITIEIDGNHILQWYGLNDGKPDKEKINGWLNRYTNHLMRPKRMMKEASAAVLQPAM